MADNKSQDRLRSFHQRVDASMALRWFGRLYDVVIVVLAVLNLKVAIRASSAIHRAVRVGTVAKLVPDVHRLLGPLGCGNTKAVADEIHETALKNRVLSRLVDRVGHGCLVPLITTSSLARLVQVIQADQPTVVAMVHSGPYTAIHSALHELEIPALVITMEQATWGASRIVESVPICDSDIDPSGFSRIAASKLCLDRLRENGLVLVPIDGAGSTPYRAPILGRQVELPAGAAALAVASGASILPVQAAWTSSNEIDLVVGDPIVPGDFKTDDVERSMILCAAKWFDCRLRDSVGQLSLMMLKRLSNAPLATIPEFTLVRGEPPVT